MKIVVISTTTHSKNSTSKMVLEKLMDKFRERSHDVDYIDADQLHIVKNLSCYSDGGKTCASPEAGKYRCWANKLSHEKPSEYGGKDEMGVIYDALDWCDLVIWGTSVRWGSHSALMQKIIERMTNIENRVVVYGEENYVKGKKCGVVVTGNNYESDSVANHLAQQLGWFGFDTNPGRTFTWQKSQDIHYEQEDNNNDPLEAYLNSKEGKSQVDNFLSSMGLK